MNRTIPRPKRDNEPPAMYAPMAQQQPAGYGQRYDQPLLAIGESARRNVYIPDPLPNDGPPRSQADASPPVEKHHGFAAGGGVTYNGFPPALTYVKRIGNMVTRALARNQLAGNIDAQWRVGGVSLPPDRGYGIGQSIAADAIWPDNPQVYMRNPGIRPMAGLPSTYRYAPNMNLFVQPVGPSIGDVGSSITVR